MEAFSARLYKACEDKELSEDYARELAILYREIAGVTAAGLDSEKREGMVNTMGGKVLKLQAELWMEEGIEQGIEQDIEQGIEQERVNTEREKKRADKAELRIRELEEEIASLRAVNQA